MIIKDERWYTALKWIATVFLPAITALWLGLSKVWGFPFAEEIGATLALITTFLGALLGIGSIRYQLLNSDKNEAEG
jgi:hypothetical protein